MSGRVAVGEVTQEFADGGFYVKSKLETVARDILNDQFAKDEAGKKESGEAAEKLAPLSEDDIKYLTNEFEISRGDAEKALRAQEGDLLKTAQALVGLPTAGSS